MQTHVLTRWLLVLAAFTLFLTGCKPTENNIPQPTTLSQKLLTGSNLNLFRTAITRAGLDASLAQSGSLTVFAPSDSAFIIAGYADVNAVSAIPVDTLKRLLQYHVLNTKLLSSSIATGVINAPLQTLAGPPVYITKTTTTTVSSSSSTTAVTTVTGRTSVNGARLVQTDVEGTNGVIHVIDRLLIPPTGDIIQTLARLSAKGPNSFSLLTAALTRANLADILQGRTINSGPFTLFAPTDQAFRTAMPAIQTVADINALPVTTLSSVLIGHITSGTIGSVRVYTPPLINGTQLPLLGGGYGMLTVNVVTRTNINVTYSNGTVTGPSAAIIQADNTATNGVVQVIDRLLLPLK